MKHQNFTILALIFLLPFCSPQKNHSYKKISGETFGTYYHITYKESKFLIKNQYTKKSLQRYVEEELNRLSGYFSTYDENSILSKWNKRRNLYYYKMPSIIYDRINNANKIYKESGGLYDVTINPLYRIWNFYQKENTNRVPTPSQINNILQYTGMNKVKLHNGKIRKIHPKVEIDLSSIAKGYAVDHIASLFSENFKIHNFLIEIGGEIRLAGLSSIGEKWKIALEKPLDYLNNSNREIYKIVNLTDVSIASSGNYQNYYIINGKKYSHIINPKTGHPIERKNQIVTVIYKNCEMADAYATAFFSMDREDGLQLANAHNLAVNYGYYDEQGNFKELASKIFQKFVN